MKWCPRQSLGNYRADACRDNVEDALEKMQGCIDNAAQSLIPAEVDPEKTKQIEKQCVPPPHASHPACSTTYSRAGWPFAAALRTMGS